MTTIDIKNWKGNELHQIMGNYVKNIHRTAITSELLAVDTGKMKKFTRIAKGPDGFEIDAMDSLANFSGRGGQPFYYPYKYSFEGYPTSKVPQRRTGRDYLLDAVKRTPFTDTNPGFSDPVVDSWVNSAGRNIRLVGRLLK